MIKKEFTKQGIKLTHPSGVVCLLTKERIADLIKQREKMLEILKKQIAAMKADLTKLLNV